MDDVLPLTIKEVTVNVPDSSSEESSVDWMQTYSHQELRDSQMGDPDISPVISWLEANDTPTSDILQLHSPAVKHLWLCKSQLVLDNGVLFYKWEDVIARKCLVVRKLLKDEVLKYCHDVRLAGHLGQKKTLQILKQGFFRHNMRQDSQIYVDSCSTCSLNKKPKTWPRAGLGSYHAGAPILTY